MNRMRPLLIALFFVGWVIAVMARQPSAPLLLKQDRDGAPAVNLTAAELGTLGDPFFELVLKKQPTVARLSEVERLLQPDESQRKTFVVDERIADPRPGQHRRAVISFTGTNGGVILEANVMLSVGFNSEEFPDVPRFIEAWGWDNHRGRYNYYKLDNTGTPDLRKTWKFRGSSVDADLLSASDRVGTCLQCHINGAPLMKELLFPWNNWHSDAASSNTTYLTVGAPPNVRWRVASDPHLSDTRLAGAEVLERPIIDGIRQFNTRRINAHKQRADATGDIAVINGRVTILDARRLLRPLFVTTEVNLISANQRSGLHPFPGVSTKGPDRPILVPASFFLNSHLLGSGGGILGYGGLGIQAASQFGTLLSLQPAEYRRLVVDGKLQLAGREPADAEFAWFVPEPSHIDNDLVDQLLRGGIVSRGFAAAVLGLDLEAPVLSEARASLLKFVPDTFSFTPGGGDDELSQLVVANIRAGSPSPGSPEQELLNVLEAGDPLKALQGKVAAYQQRVETALRTNRGVEVDRLFAVMIKRRERMINDDVLGPLDETGDSLLPLPPLSRRPFTGSGGQIVK